MEQEYLELERAWTGPRSETRQIDLRRRIALEMRRHRADEPFFQDARTQQRLERLLRAYLHRQSADFHPGMVHLLSPFVHLYSHGELSGVSGGAAEANAYHCFRELMKRLQLVLTFDGAKKMVVTFMTLLRHTLPELYSYLEEQQCAGGAWLNSWLQLLLSKELPLPCLLRLWDSYLSLHPTKHSGSASVQEIAASYETLLQERHVFVCLAILETCNEELMELDDAELVWYLHHLPHMDISQVITRAANLWDDCISRNIVQSLVGLG